MCVCVHLYVSSWQNEVVETPAVVRKKRYRFEAEVGLWVPDR